MYGGFAPLGVVAPAFEKNKNGVLYFNIRIGHGVVAPDATIIERPG